MASRLADALAELEPGAAAVSQFLDPATGGWVVQAYYEAGAPDADLIARTCRALAPAWSGDVVLEAVPDADWVAISQAALPPVSAGPFLIHGSHDRSVGAGRRWAIEIDAGEAFGTAHHASTRGCLEALGRLVRLRRYQRVLDLGCGSGVLAFAAARAQPSASVVACDIDPRAVAVARDNARANGLAGRIAFAVADGLAHPLLRRRAGFDLVLANILAEPLIQLAPRMAQIVRPGGSAILSGVLDREAEKVAAAYRAAGFTLVRSLRREGWTTLLLQRRSSRAGRLTASSCWRHRPWRAVP